MHFELMSTQKKEGHRRYEITNMPQASSEPERHCIFSFPRHVIKHLRSFKFCEHLMRGGLPRTQEPHALPPCLAKPILNETLFLYSSINIVGLNAILIKEKANAQLSIYFVRKLFASSGKRIEVEIYLYAFIIDARQL